MKRGVQRKGEYARQIIAGLALFAFTLHFFTVALAASSTQPEWDGLVGLYGICHSSNQPQGPLQQDHHDPLACCFHHCCSLSDGFDAPAFLSRALAPRLLAVAIVFDGANKTISRNTTRHKSQPRAPPVTA